MNTTRLPGLEPILGNLPVLAAIAIAMALAVLVAGEIVDIRQDLRHRERRRVSRDLATVISGDDEAASGSAERLVGVSPRTLLPILQGLAADLDGEADERLRMLVSVTGAGRSIRRLRRSRRWRRRAQAAALCPLLPEGDPRRIGLLRDRHPVVRARAAESLERSDILDALPHLLRHLDDPSDAVRFSAQHALLQGDGRIVPSLVEYLRRAEGPGVVWALEVAASLNDPRLADVVLRHAESDDPLRRAMATCSLSPSGPGLELLRGLLADTDPRVRANACAAAAASAGGDVLTAEIGRLLRDRAWSVRQAAGASLVQMGAVGAMVLRTHLVDLDPYARDMARRALDDIATRGGRSVMPAPVSSDLDAWDDVPDRVGSAA